VPKTLGYQESLELLVKETLALELNTPIKQNKKKKKTPNKQTKKNLT